jgi:hypothetical protein
MRKLLLSACTLLASLALPGVASAQSQFPGRVYQVEPDSVYVEMTDHTAVRVPNGSAIFMVHGAPVDVTELRMGEPVLVQYRVGAQPMSYSTTSNDPYHRVTIENGRVIHHVWYNGYWHRYE